MNNRELMRCAYMYANVRPFVSLETFAKDMTKAVIQWLEADADDMRQAVGTVQAYTYDQPTDTPIAKLVARAAHERATQALLAQWKDRHPDHYSWLAAVAAPIREECKRADPDFGKATHVDWSTPRPLAEWAIPTLASLGVTETCDNCYARGGHWSWCTRFSECIPPTERAPSAEPVTTRDPGPEMCCGGTCVRALCVFHGPGA